jgi:hypothetical protein
MVRMTIRLRSAAQLMPRRSVVPKEKPNQASNKTGLLGGSLRPSHGATVVCSFD